MAALTQLTIGTWPSIIFSFIFQAALLQFMPIYGTGAFFTRCLEILGKSVHSATSDPVHLVEGLSEGLRQRKVR